MAQADAHFVVIKNELDYLTEKDFGWSPRAFTVMTDKWDVYRKDILGVVVKWISECVKCPTAHAVRVTRNPHLQRPPPPPARAPARSLTPTNPSPQGLRGKVHHHRRLRMPRGHGR